jgi:hypothetical protein
MVQQAHKQTKVPDTSRKNTSEEIEQFQVPDNATSFIQPQFSNPLSTSPSSVMQLQRTVGNHATIQLLRQNTVGNTGVATIQRWPKWLDKLLNKPAAAPLLSSDSEDSSTDTDNEEQMSKLEKVKETLQEWADKYAIHTNYQKYAKYLGNSAWKKAMQVWEYVNKALGVLSNLDPSGIAAAVSAVSKLIKKIAEYVTEAYEMVTDVDLIEQLTPLISGSILEAVKGSITEIKGIWDAGEAVWDAVGDLI